MVQITFLTLFLGLTAGKQPVALAVQGPVAAVELVLDGTAVVRLTGRPWRTRLDFGAALEPHELVARALDDKGQEVGRARQVLNLPRPPAEMDVLLENDPDGPAGHPTAARLTWSSLTNEKPAAVNVVFDGQSLPVDETGRVSLPPYDPEVSHILSAEARFAGTVSARKDVGVGGRMGEISADLTAVPVRAREGHEVPRAAALGGWFLAAGKPVAVAAVEDPPAQLLVVRDGEARRALAGFERQRMVDLRAGVVERLRGEMTLDKDDQIRFIWPAARSFKGGGVPAELFDASRDYTAKDGGLLWFLERALPETEKSDQRLADATAVAGLQALAGNRPRAVLLVLSDKPKDVSRYGAATVRHYLEAVRVPLIVWTVGRRKTAATAAWGGAEDISSLGKLKLAFKGLEAGLAAQRIVWLEGSYLPGDVTLTPAAAEALELVR
jgi:hypothetical protein